MDMKTSNDFDNWNEVKKAAHASHDTGDIFFREHEIWWCYIGVNIGHEEDGKGGKSLRPILILRKFTQDTFIGLPLTTSEKRHQFIVRCDSEDGVFRQAIVSQLRTIDVKRWYKNITLVSQESFSLIRKTVRELF